ncbi:molybdopterin-dependent oxidoreductase [Actinokineospora sp. NBRC 105648]|uniref:molybdopterin-dependent oxidoreductase n=1 Tax=Actinokineospora sp. NBRC 105648 TaxID=3032206 RepID=UPI0024A315EA|nr:molybdopterin-dependent oxidoreductase [Actinokineospora sp. NBRC 105648]GLZ41786.1 molybdopterin-binding protein [Actinokineospora sp. NBRC 105648]
MSLKGLRTRLEELPERFTSPAHDERVTSRVGRWLGIAFGLCFVTGLLSHGIQHPPSWFGWPAGPVWLYRVTQGVHVLSGIVAIPLLLAKLWSVYPKLFERPLARSALHALERGSILVLSGAALFELVTGLFNVAQNYLWGFYFPTLHYAVAWVAIGSILVHVAVKLPVIRRGLAGSIDGSRRRFLRTTWLGAGVAFVATAGVTVPLLRSVSVLSWRSARGLPVNRTAAAAGIEVPAGWRLEVVGPRRMSLSLADLAALPQTTAELPIACVEGWSASASWTGVRIRDLLDAVGAPAGTAVQVYSLERSGLYSTSTLPATHTAATLLALRLDGEELTPDHGYPCRIIAPNRPGVLQTKWVTRLEVVA